MQFTRRFSLSGVFDSPSPVALETGSLKCRHCAIHRNLQDI